MRVIPLACVAGILFANGNALAQSAGTWSGKVGYNEFMPKVSSGDITGVPNGKVDVGNGGGIFGSAMYMLTDQASVELAFGVPPKLDIEGRGTIEKAGKIADTKVWSPILMFQYRFGGTDSLFRPYVGLGGTYTKYTSVTTTPMLSMLTNPGGTTTASIDSAWGFVGQVGATYKLSDHWFLDGSIVPMRLKTTAHLSTGQSVDVSVNPLLVNLAVGYRF
ncbi:OmpW/AlkL family protein [Massilia putida]|uniref:OmpW/AlkL family protein n=1 Tax=Massilia putida TaxID=1141883 RepID=UPI000950F870|nr:OmpW family outer membrane protein [Massilia putida]